MPHVEQELLTLPEHLSSLLGKSGDRVAPYLLLCLVFCRSLLLDLLALYVYFIKACFKCDKNANHKSFTVKMVIFVGG